MAIAPETATDVQATTAPRRRRWIAAVIVGVLLLALAGSMYIYLRRIESGYGRARHSADVVQTQLDNASQGQGLNGDSLDELNENIANLQSDLSDLNDQLDTPVLGSIARNAPFISPKVRATEQLLDVGIQFTSIASEGTQLAIEIRDAFEQTGFSVSASADGPTWLDVVREHRAQIDDLQQRFDAAVAARQQVDEENLTYRGQTALATIDKMIDRASRIRDDYVSLIPLLDPALGANEDAHYFVLLQNGEELRQTGGFPGTCALITIRDGRLADIQIQSIVKLDKDYIANRDTVLLAPGPIREYLKQQEWLPHDAAWSADFPTAAQSFLRMYDIAGWPKLQGVIALDYSAVQDVLRIIGPYQVEVQGETATVSADGVIPLIEEFRETNQHKKVVGVLGQSLIDQLRGADFSVKKQVFETLRASADSREIQVYMQDQKMESQVVKRGWDGALEPAPGTPTLAMTVASLAGGKSSANIFANSELALASDGIAGITRATWTITLDNRGDPNGAPKYNGFHRTWLSLYLPEGATLVSSSLTPDPPEIVDDPNAIGYNLPMMPGEKTTLVVQFELPTPAAELLLRRQPGMNNVKFAVSGAVGACAFDETFYLKHDELLDAATCDAQAAR